MEAEHRLFKLVAEVTSEGVWVPSLFIRALGGDGNSAILLRQLMYWHKKMGRPFYKSYAEWEAELGLSQHQLRRATRKLEEMGLLKTELKKANGAPTLHYSLQLDTLHKWILANGQMDLTKSANPRDLTKSANPLTGDETTTVDTPSGDTVVSAPVDLKVYEGSKENAGTLLAYLSELLQGEVPILSPARKARYGRELKGAIEGGVGYSVLSEAVERIAQRWPDYQLSVEQAIRDLQARRAGKRPPSEPMHPQGEEAKKYVDRPASPAWYVAMFGCEWDAAEEAIQTLASHDAICKRLERKR